MTVLDTLRDMRTAAAANGIIVAFHVYVALALEGLWFLIPVIIVGALIAGAAFTKGRLGAGLLALPTAGYLLLIPELINALSSENTPGIMEYALIPFWFATIVVNLLVIYTEWTGASHPPSEA
ncbi:MAG: hypothetical protein CMC99_05980 [Flavobacteriales bacterium]|nr:hypothetical protein [Flavobacteriales bacterium]|tara:strand:+ start:857 stop:1225 length:369 start_codon:yes stop_codon:yes gene_type:complete